MYTPSVLLLLASSGLIEARTLLDARHVHHHARHVDLHARASNTNGGNGASGLQLLPNAIQSGSFNDGSNEIGANEKAQAKSLTSTNNFINLCAGKTLSNGLQITTGSCNGIPMGDIPAKNVMVSSIITFPIAGSADIQSDTTFNITVQMSNIVAGSFTNADATYFSAPQALSGGKVIGHTHVTVQDMGASLNPTSPLDATQFAFFKGINDAGNGNGLLSATVTGGLPAGNYRVCTMAASSNHQPVIMPVAQRGTADDCTKFTVIGNGKVANAASNNGEKGQAAAALAASAVAAGPNHVESSAASKATSSADTKNTGKNTATKSAAKSTGAKAATKPGENKSTASKDTATKVSNKSTAVKATSVASKNTKSNNVAATSSAENKNTKTKAAATSSVEIKNTKSNKAASTSSVATNLGKGNAAATSKAASKGGSTVIVKKVVVIESFFEFSLSLGGLPPAVGQREEGFVVEEEIFTDIISAAGAACTAQWKTCIGFSGPNFSFERCSSQKESCKSAASVQTSAKQATTITATATVPPSATVTGSVLAESTVTTSIPASSQVAGSSLPVQAASSVVAQSASASASVSASASSSSSAPTKSAIASPSSSAPTKAAVASSSPVSSQAAKPTSQAAKSSSQASSSQAAKPTAQSTQTQPSKAKATKASSVSVPAASTSAPAVKSAA